MLELTAAQTVAGMQYLADHENVRVDGAALRTVADPAEAAVAVAAETADRVRAVLDAYPGQPIVLLSGGVDSLLVAATATDLGVRPHAITVVTGADTDDYGPASAAARALGLSHEVITLDRADVVRLARRATNVLGTSELWEVAAAMPLLAAESAISTHAVGQPGDSAILTGSGADAVFAGGRTLTAPLGTPSATAELDTLIRTEVGTNFVRARLVPDFYERLLDARAAMLIHVFQTERFWQIGRQLAPTALFQDIDGVVWDKMPLRIACERVLPGDAGALAWTRKAPIQRATGLFAALADAARVAAAELPGACTYSNPLVEPIESVAIRLYLHTLGTA
ncbi:asparagine synthase [Rhodococcus sp. ABRD24]|uniref:asparagine synthase C-terminal domain-containing protein n=1 Tax=Rhodococcus sp. ABRD24 TaxID=2507582 RepID=UPI00103DFFA8|nr:asparagine synthase C-terminal domain-containing protein [Rhodococcus sp. ABRD24]QBJ96815.1 asparagine synthase [Rhodococcus sp. ABRD24]